MNKDYGKDVDGWKCHDAPASFRKKAIALCRSATIDENGEKKCKMCTRSKQKSYKVVMCVSDLPPGLHYSQPLR